MAFIGDFEDSDEWLDDKVNSAIGLSWSWNNQYWPLSANTKCRALSAEATWNRRCHFDHTGNHSAITGMGHASRPPWIFDFILFYAAASADLIEMAQYNINRLLKVKVTISSFQSCNPVSAISKLEFRANLKEQVWLCLLINHLTYVPPLHLSQKNWWPLYHEVLMDERRRKGAQREPFQDPERKKLAFAGHGTRRNITSLKTSQM